MEKAIMSEGPVQVDVIHQGVAHGSVAQRLLEAGFNVNALRTNATLRYDEWKHYDTVVLEAMQQRLNGVSDLMSRGLSMTIPNGMASTVLQYEDASDMNGAELNMDGVTRGKNDRLEYALKYLPLPIIHKDFQINARVLASSRVTGAPLDTSQAALAARKVGEKVESILFTGSSTFTFGGGTIYGYEDFTNRNTVSLAKQWDAAGTTGAEILADVLAMKQKEITDRFFGPYVLYVPTSYETKLDDDFKANSDLTIRQRLLQVDGIQAVKVSDFLTAHHVALVQMTSDVVRMVEGLPVTTVEWQTEGNMIFHFKVMTIMVPQIRADQNGLCGVCILA